MKYLEWKRNNYCIGLSYDYNTLLDLHWFFNNHVIFSVFLYFRIYGENFRQGYGFLLPYSRPLPTSLLASANKGGEGGEREKGAKGKREGFLTLSPQSPLFSPSSQSPTLTQAISPHSYELFLSCTLLVTRSKLNKEVNTNNSTVWLVPYTCAQPYFLGSRSQLQRFRLY